MRHSPVSLALLLACSLSGFAAEDSLQLSAFEEPISAEWRSNSEKIPAFTLIQDPEKVKEGAGSGMWRATAPSNPWLMLNECPPDWSDYEALSVWIYAEVANEQQINFVAESGEGYYLHPVKVSWTGWNHLVIPFASFNSPRPVNGWNDISHFRITLKGYGQQEPYEDTVLYFDDLRLIRR